jgi:hypothetical protein
VAGLARAAALFLLLTAVMTWPMARRLRVVDAGDSAFFAWVIGWELHALADDPARLPHGNIFHPLPYTLGMDEPVLGTTILVAPLAAFTTDAVLLFNVARLLTFVVSGLTAYACARGLGSTEGPALVAGAAFAFSPIRTDQLAHLSTLGTQWLPLVVLFAFRFFREGRARDAVLAAGSFVLAGLACGYHAVIGLLVLPLAVLPVAWGRWNRMPMAALAAALAGLGLLPVYLLHRAALDPLGYVRGAGETAHFSAPLEAFLATSARNRVWGEATAPFRTLHSNNLFPGLVLPGLVLAGAIALWRDGRRPTREAVGLAILALAAAAVAVGPEITAFGTVLLPGPFALARELAVFRMIRVPSRSGAFLALALALLAARALHRWRDRPAWIAAAGAAAILETVIAPVPMPAWAQAVDSSGPAPAVYAWLAAQPGAPAVVELPILDIGGVFERPAFHESIYMVQSTRHWKPLLNGYAGIEPPSYVELREQALRFPSRESLDAFSSRGARYVIVHRGGFGPNKWQRIERELPAWVEGPAPRLRRVAELDDDLVFELLD